MLFDPQKIRPPFISLFFLLIATGINALLKPDPIIPPPYNWLGLVLLADGIAIMARTHRTFTRHGTSVSHAETPQKVVTEGFFKYSRNPMYVGGGLLFFGLACTVGTWPFFAAWALIGVALHFIYIPWEERRMEALFGEEYLKYKERTRKWI